MANIFIAVPQYKKMPDAEVQRIKQKLEMGNWKTSLKGFHPAFDASMVNLFNAKRHKMELLKVNGDGNLPRVRAYQMGLWKHEWEIGNKYEYFMVIDEDISFPPEAIDILVEDDKPIVGGIYTFKTEDPHYTGKPCTRFYADQFGDMSGPFKVKWLNGGFILIKAEVLFNMIEAYKDLAFMLDDASDVISESWALWCPFVYEKTFLSEDWAFCQRAHDIGYDIWADWRTKLYHWNDENGYSLSLGGEAA